MQQLLSQKEFIEKYNRGERIFSNVLLQFLDISGMAFDGLVVKDSKLLFCTFRDCLLKGVRFENCEVYFGSFYAGQISGTAFEKCTIELTLFDSIMFDSTKLDACSIRLSAILNSNAGSVDASTSTGRLMTDVSQITPQDLEGSVSEVLGVIQRLDVGLRMKIKEMMRKDAERYGLEHREERKGGQYGADKAGEATFTYGEVKTLIESAFGAYSRKSVYETKPKYEAQNAYRDRN